MHPVNRRVSPLALAFLFSVAAPVRIVQAQQDSPPPQSLTQMSLEDLMRLQVEPVFGASKRLQPVTEAPASVTIVTAEDISRHGWRTVADILRNVRGFYVTYDRNYSYIGVRGFALPGDYNTRVLFLVDGHRMNDNIYDQATPGSEFNLDPSTFARVEIIRGPASSLYGTSAFFGVVNITTKKGAAQNGLTASVDGGSLGTRALRGAFGRKLTNGIDFYISGAFAGVSGTDLYFPEFDTPDTNGGVVSGLDDETAGSVFGRLSFGNFTISGAFGGRDKGVPTAAFDTVFGDERFRTQDERAYVDAQYERTIGETRVFLRTSFDRYHYEGRYPTEGWEETPPVFMSDDYATGIWIGGEARATRAINSRHTVTAGTELRSNVRQHQGVTFEDDIFPSFLIARSSHVGAVYVQDEFKLTDRIIVNGGLRFDAYPGFSKLAPRIAVIFNSSQTQAFKYLYGNAFRAPNAYELYYSAYGERDADLDPETIDTHEIIWERYAGQSVRTSASLFFNRVNRLISVVGTEDESDLVFVNRGRVRAAGLELEGEVRMPSGISALASYVHQRTEDLESGDGLTNSPTHVAKVLLSAALASRVITSVDVQMMSSRRTLLGDDVGAVALTNVTVTVPVGHGLKVVGMFRNLFDQTYFDPGSEEHRQDALRQDGRTIRVGLDWTFGVK
jgi:outer membrane receptor for ferrienterochelin and colicins